MGFTEEILKWYRANRRNLPWRETKDPYKIWLSEVMLQQTRIAQGLPYYLKFIAHFPTVAELAAASEKKVLKLWQGLGYYSRARNLHQTARMVHSEMGGRFPDSYKGLRALKGVGDYTASAIASICYGHPEPVVDGNVYRVLARYFGVDINADSSAGVRYFKELAREVMHVGRPGEYNQAIMEFGAIQCVPSRPACHDCPLANSCAALLHNRVGELPVKKKKPPVRKRYFNYLVPIDPERKTVLKQREKGDIWQQLYEFPLVESGEAIEAAQLREKLPEYLPALAEPGIHPANKGEIVHKLSHQHLHTRFWICPVAGSLEQGIDLEDAESYPVPVLIADFIKTLKNSYF